MNLSKISFHFDGRNIQRFLIFCGIAIFLGCGCAPKVANRNSSGADIICFGDSLTEGVGASLSESYPAVLGRKLQAEVINAGHRGDTSQDALARLDRDVLSKNPRLVIVEFGANDFLERIPRKKTFENIEKIVERIQDKGAMVALATVKIGILTDEYFYGYKEIARRHKTILIPQILKGIFENPSLKSDGFHPNAKGYALVAERVYKEIAPYVTH